MRILTGDRPSGRLHLGHLVGSLQNRVALQNKEDVEQYIIIADVQALTDDAHRNTQLKENIHQVICDYMAFGIDPLKSTIFIQSMIPEIAELTVFFLNLVTVSRLRRNPTIKAEMIQKGFDDTMPAGFLTYPVSQAADILLFSPTDIPVGEDQLPMIEQTNEIARTFNNFYETQLFSPVNALIPKVGRLMGTDGKAKMSKSLGNAIYLSDSADVIVQKVKSMYTDPNHIRVEDPGSIEGNVVFSYLDIFDPRVDEVNELKERYQKGGLGDMVLKRRLMDVLNGLLEPLRIKRALYENDRQETARIAEEGTARAQKTAQKTMNLVRKAMKINYFG